VWRYDSEHYSIKAWTKYQSKQRIAWRWGIMSRVLILTKEGCCAEMFQCRLSICCHGLPARKWGRRSVGAFGDHDTPMGLNSGIIDCYKLNRHMSET
jgi:hypothetical protein